MKKTSSKRATAVQQDRIIIKKPFGFCCDKKGQDPETHYDRRKPPFKGSLTDVVVGNGGPSLKFRVQDIGPLPYPIHRSTSRVKGAAFLGDCKRCRPPLRWYIEDEIALARDIVARERQAQYNFEMDKNVEIAKQKKQLRMDRKAARRMKIMAR
ncbi:hypothetical protein KPH14_005430 [Odynerus spinipes]|uniref:Uncharacterized protein n=1 Tax=Odynerus spinipes TaxID=1348599 RepID=A0AAD9RBP9_9HYME|nr:hypothetical protein KPH14_005430 [Odynerus spinipes]